jgi:hypothetical protein
MDVAVRTCGTCGETKPLSEFYKDGKDKEGNVKYRRDCKECYRITRLRARQMKRGRS